MLSACRAATKKRIHLYFKAAQWEQPCQDFPHSAALITHILAFGCGGCVNVCDGGGWTARFHGNHKKQTARRRLSRHVLCSFYTKPSKCILEESVSQSVSHTWKQPELNLTTEPLRRDSGIVSGAWLTAQDVSDHHLTPGVTSCEPQLWFQTLVFSLINNSAAQGPNISLTSLWQMNLLRPRGHVVL